MVAGSLTYDTKMNTSGFQKGINQITNATQSGGTKIKNIIAALGITKLISAGINTVMGSLGDAISRLDILNNYPKVMSNLGIATDKAQSSIDKMSDKLSGLPTTLDSAALSVQRFTSANGDVEKSTNYFLALNNALLAGGASAGIQESAMEQLSQAYAKGKPDAMEWRSILTAMPGQLKQVAKQLGYTSTAVGGDLYEAIQKGKISMDDFMKAIVQLNEKGIDGFQSFEEQARNSTDGLATAIKVAKTQVVKGLTEILKATNQVLKDKGLGGISGVISNIGKKAKEFLDLIAKNLPKVVSYIESAFKILKKLLPVITAVVSALIAYKATLLVIKGINFVSSIAGTVSAFMSLIPLITDAKDAMILFNMATKANPIGILVAGIAALGTAVVLMNKNINEDINAQKDLTKELLNQKKAMEEVKQQRQENLNASLSEIENAKRLKDELVKLVDENGRVKEGYQGRVSVILGELNQALGTEYSMTGDVINQYKDLVKSIDDTIEKKKASIILNSKEEAYTEAINNQKTAQQKLAEIQKDLNERKEKYRQIDEKIRKAQSEGDYSKVDQRWLAERSHLKELVSETEKSYNEQKDIIKEYYNDITDYEDTAALVHEGTADAIKKVNDSVLFSYQDRKDKTISSLNDSLKMEKASLDASVQLYQETGSKIALTQQQQSQENIKNLAAELVARTSTIDTLGDEEIQAWKSLAEASFGEYSLAIAPLDEETQKKIQDATGVIAAGTPQMQAKAGELGRKTVDEFDRSADARNKALNTITGYLNGLDDNTKRELLRQAGIQDVDIVLKELDKGNLSEKHGRDILQGLWKGLQDGSWQGKILGAASSLAQAVNRAFTGKNGWDEHSPSKKMQKYVENYLQPITAGMKKEEKNIVSSASKLANKINDVFSNNSEDMYKKIESAVNIQAGKMNATATIRSNNMFNNVIQINAKLDGKVEMDKKTTGQILAPEVTKAIKVGGLV